ncbi:hypothetical protein GIY30_02380 [Gordonia sp. HNM0687]|uniref:Uncharacterized protein n=1 Tax=Gordonia mangrovi TaxID=2665643 RepID=A0A6L7GNU7_9ACTN|nr:hypothetical protein [Gordonia mangrovi]MXP20218.1 hypothetical protein [Gordonia mangrovi]UVF79173.1 hypothetical protein NWF22_04850 [Gordonia mangrovi]
MTSDDEMAAVNRVRFRLEALVLGRSPDPGGPLGDQYVVGRSAAGAPYGHQAGAVYNTRSTGTVMTAGMCPAGIRQLQLSFTGSTTSQDDPVNIHIAMQGDCPSILLKRDGKVRRIPM